MITGQGSPEQVTGGHLASENTRLVVAGLGNRAALVLLILASLLCLPHRGEAFCTAFRLVRGASVVAENE